MDKNLELKIKKAAVYIIENNATISQTADHLNVSVSTIKKWINNDDKLKSIDENLYNKVKKVQDEIINLGNIKGGEAGTREGTYKNSDFDILEIIETMISEGLTLVEASQRFNVPKSTIYDRAINYNDEKVVEEVKILFDEHKKDATQGLK